MTAPLVPGPPCPQPVQEPVTSSAPGWIDRGHIRRWTGCAVAVGLVVFSHAYLTDNFPAFAPVKVIVQIGEVGVDVFFVLSGFLITILLCRESDRTGRVSLRGFYTRRALTHPAGVRVPPRGRGADAGRRVGRGPRARLGGRRHVHDELPRAPGVGTGTHLEPVDRGTLLPGLAADLHPPAPAGGLENPHRHSGGRAGDPLDNTAVEPDCLRRSRIGLSSGSIRSPAGACWH